MCHPEHVSELALKLRMRDAEGRPTNTLKADLLAELLHGLDKRLATLEAAPKADARFEVKCEIPNCEVCAAQAPK